MKNILKLILSLLLSQFNFLNSEMQYRRAIESDVSAILELINSKAINDSDKIVIVPAKFRELVLLSTIAQGRLFVAVEHCPAKTKIVGFKKMFLITDNKELCGTLLHEIRCKELTDTKGAFIYDGADFTHPEYRGRGINRNLTDFAFLDIQYQVNEYLKAIKANNIILLFGLTQANEGRLRSILESFKVFASKFNYSYLKINKNRAFMPTFDPKSDECVPLSDDKSVPGHGYAVVGSSDEK